MKIRSAIVLTATAALLAVGCGGEDEKEAGDVSASTRVERCVEEYPSSTKDECEDWERDGQLGDDGTHQDHEDS